MSLECVKFYLGQISTDLDIVEKWFNSNGISVAKNRFAEVKENMFTISTLYRQGKLNELPPAWGNEKIIASIVEATSFVNIYNEFRDYENCPTLQDSLQRVIKGPYLSQKEDGTTNDARNILFELELAATFASKGIKILDFNDVSFELEDTIWNIQCKRSINVRNLEGHIERAVQQGQHFFNQTKSKLAPRGIIAISIDKILGTDKAVIRTLDSNALKSYVDNKLNEFVKQCSHKWNKIIDGRFLAVFIFMRAVVEVSNPLTFGPIRHIGIDHLLSGSIDRTRDAQRLRLLAKLLVNN